MKQREPELIQGLKSVGVCGRGAKMHGVFASPNSWLEQLWFRIRPQNKMLDFLAHFGGLENCIEFGSQRMLRHSHWSIDGSP